MAGGEAGDDLAVSANQKLGEVPFDVAAELGPMSLRTPLVAADFACAGTTARESRARLRRRKGFMGVCSSPPAFFPAQRLGAGTKRKSPALTRVKAGP